MLVASGSRSAKRLMSLLQNLNAYLSACQLGITLASLGLGWLGEPAFLIWVIVVVMVDLRKVRRRRGS